MFKRRALGWPNAVGVSALTLLLLVLVFFYVPHWILSELRTLARGVRVWIATGWTAAAFSVACHAAWRISRSNIPANTPSPGE